MNRIAIITATRAEYGLLTPLIKKVYNDNELTLNLIVTGTHLSDQYGHTIDDIYKDGFPIAHEISILEKDNTPQGVSLTMANAIRGFAKCFHEDRPDMVVILGDRTEMLGIVAAAMNERIPIAHIHGGEVTAGAVDDGVRHAITKMSFLHFTCTEVYRNRVIQLGENPSRVFNVGSLGTENILTQPILSFEKLRQQIPGLPDCKEKPYAMVTFHPVTLEENSVERQVEELCNAMNIRNDIFFLITAANADAGGDRANELLIKYCEGHANGKFVHNLGMLRYLSAVKYAGFVLGNSSSGILEAPVIGTPTVNIGNRQEGRLMPASVINCDTDCISILEGIEKVVCMEHKPTGLYGDGNTSAKIKEIMKQFLESGTINLMKGFYDI